MRRITEKGGTRWVFVRVYNSRTTANARRFLRDLERTCPTRFRMVLTDNGKEFTDRLFGLRKRVATGKHEFDLLCTDLGIEHRLAPPQHPQTNGKPPSHGCQENRCPLPGRAFSHAREGGNGAFQRPHRGGPAKPPFPFPRRVGNRAAPLRAALTQQLPQLDLGSKTPLQAMNGWHKTEAGVVQETALSPSGM